MGNPAERHLPARPSQILRMRISRKLFPIVRRYIGDQWVERFGVSIIKVNALFEPLILLSQHEDNLLSTISVQAHWLASFELRHLIARKLYRRLHISTQSFIGGKCSP